MRSILFYLLAVSVFFSFGFSSCKSTKTGDVSAAGTEHTSRNSFDWEGVYTGLIPAASSPGIQVQITLNSDRTFELQYQYTERDSGVIIRNGTFNWDETENISIRQITG
jgi:uncharacterized lipoprotein NlpE involved in copper resistance